MGNPHPHTGRQPQDKDRSNLPPTSPPSIIRNPILEERVQRIASAALAARQGLAPRSAFHNYVSNHVFHQLKSQSQQTLTPDTDANGGSDTGTEMNSGTGTDSDTGSAASGNTNSNLGYKARSYLCSINHEVIGAIVIATTPQTTHVVAIRLERQQQIWKAVDLLII